MEHDAEIVVYFKDNDGRGVATPMTYTATKAEGKILQGNILVTRELLFSLSSLLGEAETGKLLKMEVVVEDNGEDQV